MTRSPDPPLLVPASSPANSGRVLVNITPATAQWRYVGFRVLRLARGERLVEASGELELCAVLLAGRAKAVAGAQVWDEIGGRASVFDGPPHALYLPPATDFSFEATTELLEIAIGTAPAAEGPALPPRLIEPADVKVSTRGSGCMERTIHDILMENQPAGRLLVTEVLTPGGHWSSYPPHKHDTHDPPRETYLEELYYHRLREGRGYAIQRVYTTDRSLDATLAVRDGDCVLVPAGFHPVSAAPGFDLYYLNIMAGPLRQWRITYDADVTAALEPGAATTTGAA